MDTYSKVGFYISAYHPFDIQEITDVLGILPNHIWEQKRHWLIGVKHIPQVCWGYELPVCHYSNMESPVNKLLDMFLPQKSVIVSFVTSNNLKICIDVVIHLYPNNLFCNMVCQLRTETTRKLVLLNTNFYVTPKFLRTDNSYLLSTLSEETMNNTIKPVEWDKFILDENRPTFSRGAILVIADIPFDTEKIFDISEVLGINYRQSNKKYPISNNGERTSFVLWSYELPTRHYISTEEPIKELIDIFLTKKNIIVPFMKENRLKVVFDVLYHLFHDDIERYIICELSPKTAQILSEMNVTFQITPVFH
jgi:hypothetical protein